MKNSPKKMIRKAKTTTKAKMKAGVGKKAAAKKVGLGVSQKKATRSAESIVTKSQRQSPDPSQTALLKDPAHSPGHRKMSWKNTNADSSNVKLQSHDTQATQRLSNADKAQRLTSKRRIF